MSGPPVAIAVIRVGKITCLGRNRGDDAVVFTTLCDVKGGKTSWWTYIFRRSLPVSSAHAGAHGCAELGFVHVSVGLASLDAPCVCLHPPIQPGESHGV